MKAPFSGITGFYGDRVPDVELVRAFSPLRTIAYIAPGQPACVIQRGQFVAMKPVPAIGEDVQQQKPEYDAAKREPGGAWVL